MDRINDPKHHDRKNKRDAKHVRIQNEMQKPLFLDTGEVNNVPHRSAWYNSFLVFDVKTKIISVLGVFKRHTTCQGKCLSSDRL